MDKAKLEKEQALFLDQLEDDSVEKRFERAILQISAHLTVIGGVLQEHGLITDEEWGRRLASAQAEVDQLAAKTREEKAAAFRDQFPETAKAMQFFDRIMGGKLKT